MLHFPEQPSPLLPEAVGGGSADGGGLPLAGGNPSDAVIDAALGRIALPDGFLSRLMASFAAMSSGAGEPGD
jgi:hypothetical protein